MPSWTEDNRFPSYLIELIMWGGSLLPTNWRKILLEDGLRKSY